MMCVRTMRTGGRNDVKDVRAPDENRRKLVWVWVCVGGGKGGQQKSLLYTVAGDEDTLPATCNLPPPKRTPRACRQLLYLRCVPAEQTTPAGHHVPITEEDNGTRGEEGQCVYGLVPDD